MVIRSGHDAFLLAGVQRAGAAHAAHHLVQDQQHAVAIADLANGREVARAARVVAPCVAPPTVSATNAMTRFGPQATIACSSSAASRAP